MKHNVKDPITPKPMRVQNPNTYTRGLKTHFDDGSNCK